MRNKLYINNYEKKSELHDINSEFLLISQNSAFFVSTSELNIKKVILGFLQFWEKNCKNLNILKINILISWILNILSHFASQVNASWFKNVYIDIYAGKQDKNTKNFPAQN